MQADGSNPVGFFIAKNGILGRFGAISLFVWWKCAFFCESGLDAKETGKNGISGD